MDINDWRALVTVLAFICFLAIVGWAYSVRAKRGFDEAAQIPFLEEDELRAPAARSEREGGKHG